MCPFGLSKHGTDDRVMHYGLEQHESCAALKLYFAQL